MANLAQKMVQEVRLTPLLLPSHVPEPKPEDLGKLVSPHHYSSGTLTQLVVNLM